MRSRGRYSRGRRAAWQHLEDVHGEIDAGGKLGVGRGEAVTDCIGLLRQQLFDIGDHVLEQAKREIAALVFPALARAAIAGSKTKSL